MPPGDDADAVTVGHVDESLAVERQSHGSAQLRIVERRRHTIDDDIALHIGRMGAREPFGEFASNGWAVHPAWASGPELDFTLDYGIIRLTADAGSKTFSSMGRRPLGFWGAPESNTLLTALDPATLSGQVAFTAGYPYRRGLNELAARVMRQSEGRILGSARVSHLSPTRSQGLFTANVDDTMRVLAHDVDTEKGQSGGPLWIQGNGGTLLLAGIHQGSAAWTGDNNAKMPVNNAIRFSREVLRQVRVWMSGAAWRTSANRK